MFFSGLVFFFFLLVLWLLWRCIILFGWIFVLILDCCLSVSFSRSGVILNSAYSRTLQCTPRQDRSVGTAIQGKRLTDSSLYRINGTNDTNSRLYSRDPRMLNAHDDEYGGVVVNPDKLPAKPDIFIPMLRFSLLQWKMQVQIMSACAMAVS